MRPARRREAGAVGLAMPLFAVLSVLAAVVAGACSDAPPAEPAERVEQHTLFGSNLWQAPGETRRQAAARVDATYGPIGVARIFSAGLPPTWAELGRDVGRRPVVVSFRVAPDVILSGAVDDWLTDWFRAAPTDRDTFWVYFHEPEDEVDLGHFAPQEFAAAWSHVARLADRAENPRLQATVILMCWTAGGHSGRDWRSYVPVTGAVDVLGWDCYARGSDAASYADPTALLGPARAASAELGADWAIGELGARVGPGGDGTDRAAWLAEAGAYASRHGARFVTYFDAPVGGGFQLTDEPSIRAWARLVGSSARRQGWARRTAGRTEGETP
jgi:hypothetical protein